MMLRAAALVSLVLAGLTTAVATGWGSLVLFYLAPGSETVRTVLAWGFAALGLATIGALAVRRARRPGSVGFALAFIMIVWAAPRWRMTATGSPRWASFPRPLTAIL